jgi:hypothetical protein
MYTVRQVLNPEFSRTWQEAVAIVQEAASLLQPGLALPDPEDLILNEAGTLSFGFGSESSRHPVVGLASLLDELLKGVEAPESLVSLASENMHSEPANASIDAFSRSLSFYERPNRTNDLRSVVSRLRGAPAEKSSVELEFERLREKVAGPAVVEEQQQQSRPADPAKRRVPKLTRTQQHVVAAGIIAGVLLGVIAIQGSPLPRLRGAYDRVEAKLSGTLSAGLDRLGVSQPASASPAPDAATTGVPASPEPVEKPTAARSTTKSANGASAEHSVAGRPTSRSTPSASTASPAKTTDSAGSSDRAAGIPTPGLASRSLSPPTVRAEPASVSPVAAPVAAPVPALPTVMPAPLATPPNGIYSPETPGVTPPVLTRPQMPKEPAPGDDTGYFEIIVDEKGSPELVKLISPRRRYHDRMLVAAAKAWQFRPATLDGRPVKYRILVPIILSGLPY